MNFSIQADFMNIIGFVVGIIGLFIAVWQIISARKARKMFREKCETRCKDLVETVRQLNRAVVQACRIKDENFDDLIARSSSSSETVRPLRQLGDQIHSIYDSKNQLVRFCERLNDEHKEEFGQLVYENMRGEFFDFPIQIEEGSHSRIKSQVESNSSVANS